MPTDDVSNQASNRWGLAVTAIVCLAAGSLAGAWYMRRQGTAVSPAPPVSAMPLPVDAAPSKANLVLTIPQDALARLQLGFGEVTLEPARTQIRVPGSIAPDGYREVSVTPVAGGIITEVSAELGQSVKRGQKLFRIFSQELADAQTALIGVNADFEVAHKKLTRIEELVKLGAASRQELEEVEGEHQAHSAHIAQGVQKLILLGLTPAQAQRVQSGNQVSSEVSVPAPIDGVVLTRTANLGQVVSPGQELLKVTDLSSVWVKGNLLEDHFAVVRKGSQAVITAPAYPGRVYRGVVDYIDPRVDPQTRTAKVRVIVPNRDLALRLGMYVDIEFATAESGRVVTVPSGAIQQLGGSAVVYVPVARSQNQFEQRPIKVAAETGTGRRIITGLQTGDRVVTDGSFLLRAEALRQSGQ